MLPRPTFGIFVKLKRERQGPFGKRDGKMVFDHREQGVAGLPPNGLGPSYPNRELDVDEGVVGCLVGDGVFGEPVGAGSGS